MGMQILSEKLLLNAAGAQFAGKCHSMASCDACGFVTLHHLRISVPVQEQELHLIHDPRKKLTPVFTCWASENCELNFPCFKTISFNSFRLFLD